MTDDAASAVQRETQPGSKRWLQLAIVLIAAFALRALWLDRAAVEHFDEGVYASNQMMVNSDEAYPQRDFYAPPLVPAIVEYSRLFLGQNSWGTMLPGVLFGALTVVLAFHVARRWFGMEAAWPTAIITGLSEFHIIYSRSTLTDVFLGFFLLLAVYLGTEAVRYRRVGTAVLAGIACGLAWWSKYSGWLPMAIVGTATAVWIAFHRKHTGPVKAIACVVVMCAAAAATWAPVWFGLEDVGGYAAIRANHARYVVGFAGWFESAKQQMNAHRVLDGWLAWISLSVAMLVNFGWQLRTRGFTWNQPEDQFQLSGSLLLKMCLGAAMLSLLAASGVGTTSVLFCVALGGLAGRLRWPAIPIDSEEASNEEAIARWTLPCWVLVVWIGSLSLMTPTYRAYPRLTLPLLIPIWLAAGAGISWWVRSNLRWHGRKGTERPVLQQNLMLIGLCCLAGFVIVRNGVLVKATTSAWKPRSGMRTLAASIVDECVTDRDNVVIYTYGEPALFYHLRSRGLLAQPVSSVPTSPPSGGGGTFEVLLIEGPHARRSDSFNEDSNLILRNYEKAATYDVASSDLVLLNDRDASKMLGPGGREPETFHVWRMRPATVDQTQSVDR